MLHIRYSAELGAVPAMQVAVTSEWKPDIGWELTCSWQLFSNDSLQFHIWLSQFAFSDEASVIITMWRLLLLSTFLVAVDASSIQDLDGEWVSVAFYPVSTYAPICPKYAISSNPEDPNCSCSDGKKYNSISISYVIAGQIIGNQVEPNACVIMVNTADEVASALAATCKCGEKEVKDHGVVRILNNNYFVIGIYRRPEDMMTINCEETSDRGVTGICELTMELYQPQKHSFTFACEASGERPTFRIERKAVVIEAFVPPTNAVVEVGSVNAESGRVMLNCTSSGVPAPTLVWTVGEQKVPRDFSGSFWNATSKLWHVWSVLSYTYSDEHKAVCTPEISKGSKLIQGEPAEYNSASNVKDIKSILFTVLASLLLLS
ncbi:unnamed protein product [Chrysodeixis includens]|uniref:Ig-like domain-containing protein n=1 Tax=Chrysodeixis includens TaxID=689277 RepID=A0A9N8L2N0_CHRIL|nr:unnamed protein product [Chrysodeixis includens]